MVDVAPSQKRQTMNITSQEAFIFLLQNVIETRGKKFLTVSSHLIFFYFFEQLPYDFLASKFPKTFKTIIKTDV